jgi:L-fuculose-phosphate aldolase
MRFELLHPADQLVMIMDRIYQYGMTTTSGGNLSIHDDNGDIWITPSGIDKGTLSREDMICVKPDGTIVGPHKPSVELPFHSDIYRQRPDIKAILHAHPPTLVAFSLARKIPNSMLVPSVSQICGEITMAKYEVPGSELLGQYISSEFAKGYNTVMLENHGVVCGANNLFRAFMAFETLDFAGRLEIDARKLGTPNELSQVQINIDSAKAHPSLDAFVSKNVSSEERAARRDMCKMIHRAYDQRLFNSTQGTFSQRLSDGSFLITPYMKDRKYLEPEDLVRIKNGMCEEGKTPSRSVPLHQEIYDTHPNIGSVIIAHPPAIMAFACTDTEFDSRTIPESYINLIDVKRLPYAASTMDVKGTAAAITGRTPTLIINNQCVITTGATLLNAFDRLELLEYSAKAYIACRDIGEIVTISPKEVDDIEEAFNLKNL